MQVPAGQLLVAQMRTTWTRAINQGLALYSLYDMHRRGQYCVVCIAVTCDSSLMIKENLCGGLCFSIYCTWCIHSCNALLLSKVAHRGNILVETFLIAIEKCLLSCFVGIIQNHESNVASFAGSFRKRLWLSCSLSESSFMAVNVWSCIEDIKQQLSHHSDWPVCAEISGSWSKCFFCYSCYFPFSSSGLLFVPEIWCLTFSSYFSRSSTMDVFPSMGRHILD